MQTMSVVKGWDRINWVGQDMNGLNRMRWDRMGGLRGMGCDWIALGGIG